MKSDLDQNEIEIQQPEEKMLAMQNNSFDLKN